ncbi:MAG: ATP-binding cassette domain-containing protein [Bacteroidales bacterium]|nr:ATP-binding cassette domain-containing protein [Bacteroidales bacterium]
MINIENIHKSYKKVTVLKGVNLQINKGEIVSLYGPSGAGKSTLLNIIGTLDIADDGFIQIDELKRYFGDWKFTKASKIKRLINYSIDGIVINIIYFIIGVISVLIYTWLFKTTINGSKFVYFLSLIIFIIVYFGYYSLEYKFHITLGKLITKTIVINNNGLYPSRDTIFIRTFLRFIPFEPLSLLFSSKRRGWHDSFAQTIVINRTKSVDYLNKLNSSKIKTENDLCSFRNQTIGFVFQFHQLLPEFTALENVCIPGYIKGEDKIEVEKRGKELLTTLDLSDKFEKRPSELSGGELQRVAVARALINNPQVILADEPAGNLDSINAEFLHHMFIKLRDKYGTTFLIATHNLELAKISDTTLNFIDGKIYSKTNKSH